MKCIYILILCDANKLGEVSFIFLNMESGHRNVISCDQICRHPVEGIK